MMKSISEYDLQHCFQQCKIHMEQSWDIGGEYIEGNLTLHKVSYVKNDKS